MTGRHYTVDGERYPSVTTVLTVLNKPGLALWRGRVGNVEADRISREATEHGTGIHRIVEQINLGNLRDCADVDEAARPFTAAYLRWFREHVEHVIAAERLIVSRRLQFAGTADLIAVLRGDTSPTVVDLKTSASDLGWPEWALQTAAYALGLVEEDIACKRRVIVRIPKATPGALHVHEIDPSDLERDQRAFVNALTLWRWHQKHAPEPKRQPGKRLKRGGQRWWEG